MPSHRVAALYIDPLGPYPPMLDVDAYDESRDGRTYEGPLPVVAHPPCADWSRLRALAKHVPGRRELAPLAVLQVRRWGGVLEHPAWSSLWSHCGLPRPAELPDAWGGWSIEVDQVSWGHRCQKRTWLYFVGVSRADVRPKTGGTPDRVVTTSRRSGERRLPATGSQTARRTPPLLARWLVDLAATAHRDAEVAAHA